MGYFLEPQELSASVDVTEAATGAVGLLFLAHHENTPKTNLLFEAGKTVGIDFLDR